MKRIGAGEAPISLPAAEKRLIHLDAPDMLLNPGGTRIAG